MQTYEMKTVTTNNKNVFSAATGIHQSNPHLQHFHQSIHQQNFPRTGRGMIYGSSNPDSSFNSRYQPHDMAAFNLGQLSQQVPHVPQAHNTFSTTNASSIAAFMPPNVINRPNEQSGWSLNGSTPQSPQPYPLHRPKTASYSQSNHYCPTGSRYNYRRKARSTNTIATNFAEQLPLPVDIGSGEPAREPLRDVVVLPETHTTKEQEKSPLYLINEIAHYNKLTIQYVVENEQGPPHAKVFYMTIKLGDAEQYSGSGPSIRKTQQLVAKEALQNTRLPRPPEGDRKIYKSSKKNNGCRSAFSQLNVLATRLNKEVRCSKESHRRVSFVGHPNFNVRSKYELTYSRGSLPLLHYVTIGVDSITFSGIGPSPNVAMQNASIKAIKSLQALPSKPRHHDIDVADNSPATSSAPDNQLKSGISLLHELALKHNLHISFDICMVREFGQQRCKMYTTRCILGDLMCEAEAYNKKDSKRFAAEKMLSRLRMNGPLPVSEILTPSMYSRKKKKTKNLIKKPAPEDTTHVVDSNPVNRLASVMQSLNKREPSYEFLSDSGYIYPKEFCVQVNCLDKICSGLGPNKKLAKRNAAEKMLNLLGYSPHFPQPRKPSLKNAVLASNLESNSVAMDKKVSFFESSYESDIINKDDRTGRQLIPGLILLPESSRIGNSEVKGRLLSSGNKGVSNSGPQPLTPSSSSPPSTSQLDFVHMPNGQSSHGTINVRI